MRHGFCLVFLAVLVRIAQAAPPRLEHFDPVLFELQPNARYASTDLTRWEVFTRSGVQLGKSLALEFIGAAADMRMEGVGSSPQTLSVYQGNDRSQWRPECPSYQAVAYRGLYAGIDLVYRRLDGKLKGDFIVQPGADPGQVRFRFEGGTAVVEGDRIELKDSKDQYVERIPAVYEISASGKKPLAAHYRQFPDGSIGFEVEGRDPARQLVIDPDLQFSTYLAGSLLDQVTATIYSAFDSSLLVTGWTESADLGGATLHLVQRHAVGNSAYAGGIDGYYARFAVTSTSVTLSSLALFGGSGNDKPSSIGLSPNKYVVIGGSTSSTNYPTLFPFQSKTGGGTDGFITQFYPSSTTMLTSTYFGAAGSDQITAVAMDGNNLVYFAGTTTSTTGLPLTGNAMQGYYKGGASEGFVGTLNPNITVGYCTYLGGSGTDNIAGMAVLNGEVYLTGATDSWDFPVSTSAFQRNSGGGQDAFVTKLTTAGLMSYSTYLGGSGGTVGSPETGNAIAVDSAGEAYVTGTTTSTNFPVTSGAAQAQLDNVFGAPDAFLAKFTSTGGLAFATYWGGSSWEQANAIVVLPSGYVAIAGMTLSVDFPTLYPIGAGPGPTRLYDGSVNAGSYDAFVAVFSPSGTLYWSTYLGGAGTDEATAITSNAIGEIFVGGLTGSFNFPKLNATQSNISSSGYHGFLSRIGLAKPMHGVFRPSAGQFYMVRNADFTAYIPIARYTTLSWSNVSGPDAIPVVGDWDNTGRQRLGLFRKTTGTWYLDINGDDIYTPGVDKVVNNFGAGNYPVVGDWDNTGKTRLGYFNNGLWFLDINGNNVFEYGIDTVVAFGPANSTPIVGDWTNTGKQRIGVFIGGLWYLDLLGNYNSSQPISAIAGASTDNPVFGDWDNSGIKRIGNYRTIGYPIGWWFCDINGDFKYSGSPIDDYFIFGGTNDIAVVGVRSH